MIEKIPTIRNPLTVIAIFAGISEVSMTVGLGLVDKELQGLFIWFVILFPTLLVLLFFLTLNFNHKVLYAPSDFRDEKNFFRRFAGLRAEEFKLKLEKNALELEPSLPVVTNLAATPAITETRQNKAALYSYVEGLLLYQVAKKYKAEVQREVAYGSSNLRFYFDGIIRNSTRFSITSAFLEIPRTPSSRPAR